MIGSTLQAIAGLGLVLGLILATAYGLRKLQPGRFAAGNLLRSVSALNVGARERVVVVEFGEQWLVLGVTAQSITTLHTAARGTLPTLPTLPTLSTLPSVTSTADTTAAPVSFAAQLRQWRNRFRSNDGATPTSRHEQ